MKNNDHIKNELIKMIKVHGTQVAIDTVGGYDNFKRVMNIKCPDDFLNLFKDVELVTSTLDPKITLLRHQQKYNVALLYSTSRVIFVNGNILRYVSEFKSTIFNFSPTTFTLLWFVNNYNLNHLHELREIGDNNNSVISML